MPVTNYVSEGLLSHILGTGTMATSSPVYFAFGTQQATKAGASGSSPWTDEISGNGYARVAVNPFVRIPYPADYAISNQYPLEFAAATADWGQIRGWAVFDAQSDGNMLAYGPINPAIEILKDDELTVQPGSVTMVVHILLNVQPYHPSIPRQILEFLYMGGSLTAPSLQLQLVPTPSASFGYENADAAGVWTSPEPKTEFGLDYYESKNDSQIDFPTATYDWGNGFNGMLVDTFGNKISEFQTDTGVTVNEGDQPYLAADAISQLIN